MSYSIDIIGNEVRCNGIRVAILSDEHNSVTGAFRDLLLDLPTTELDEQSEIEERLSAAENTAIERCLSAFEVIESELVEKINSLELFGGMISAAEVSSALDEAKTALEEIKGTL